MWTSVTVSKSLISLKLIVKGTSSAFFMLEKLLEVDNNNQHIWIERKRKQNGLKLDKKWKEFLNSDWNRIQMWFLDYCSLTLQLTSIVTQKICQMPCFPIDLVYFTSGVCVCVLVHFPLVPAASDTAQMALSWWWLSDGTIQSTLFIDGAPTGSKLHVGLTHACPSPKQSQMRKVPEMKRQKETRWSRWEAETGTSR